MAPEAEIIASPRVTLAMPVFNGENYIAEAIESILNQSFTDFELIITDNCSNDRTGSIYKSYATSDPRVRYVLNEENIGAANNYNRGFNLARGEYIKWCAHDDKLDPKFLEHLVAVLDSNPDIGHVYGQTICIDDKGTHIPMIGGEMPELLNKCPINRFATAINEFGTCFQIFGLYRISLLKKTTLHRPYYSSDEGLLAEVALLTRSKRVSQAIFYNREHQTRSINIEDKLSRSKWQNGKISRKSAAEHLNLLLHLYEITGRHREIAPAWRTRLVLFRFALQKEQIARYILELISFISPSLATILKVIARRGKTIGFESSRNRT